MAEREDLSAEAALREMDRAQAAVKRGSARGGRFYLGMWLGCTAYWLLALLGPTGFQGYPALGLIMLVTVTGGIHALGQRVADRTMARVVYPVTYAFVGTTVLASLYSMFLHPQEPGAPRIVAGALVALLAAAPLLYGAVRVLRAAGER